MRSARYGKVKVHAVGTVWDGLKAPPLRAQSLGDPITAMISIVIDIVTVIFAITIIRIIRIIIVLIPSASSIITMLWN